MIFPFAGLDSTLWSLAPFSSPPALSSTPAPPLPPSCDITDVETLRARVLLAVVTLVEEEEGDAVLRRRRPRRRCVSGVLVVRESLGGLGRALERTGAAVLVVVGFWNGGSIAGGPPALISCVGGNCVSEDFFLPAFWSAICFSVVVVGKGEGSLGGAVEDDGNEAGEVPARLRVGILRRRQLPMPRLLRGVVVGFGFSSRLPGVTGLDGCFLLFTFLWCLRRSSRRGSICGRHRVHWLVL